MSIDNLAIESPLTLPAERTYGREHAISCPLEVRNTVLYTRDLDLDLWIPQDRTQIVRLDENQFEEHGLCQREPTLARHARQAFAELEAIARSALDALLRI